MSNELQIIIELIAAIITGCGVLASIIIAVNTQKESAKIIEHNSKAHIIFYIDHIRTSNKFYLTLENVGNTVGKLLEIKMSPDLDYNSIDGYENNNLKPLTEAQNILLAPKQKISSWFSFANYKDKVFDITIKYITLDTNKIFNESYKIDLSYIENVESLSHHAFDCPDEKTALIYIENALYELSERIR